MSQIFSWPQRIPIDSIDYSLLLHKDANASDFFGANSTALTNVYDSTSSVATIDNHGLLSDFQWGANTLMVVGCAMLFVLFVVYRPWIVLMVRSWFDVNKVFAYMKDYGLEVRKLSFLVGIVWSYMFTLLIFYFIITKFDSSYIQAHRWYVVYMMLFAAVLGSRIIEIGIAKLCGWISEEKSQCYLEVGCVDEFWQIFSLVVIYPIIMAMMLMNFNVYWILAVVAIGAMVYLFELYRIFRVNGFVLLQWFLYLCTVKILPLAVAVALIV